MNIFRRKKAKEKKEIIDIGIEAKELRKPRTKREARALERDALWREIAYVPKNTVKCKDCAVFLRGISWIHGPLDTGSCYKECRKGKIHESDEACNEYEVDSPRNIRKWERIRDDEDEETYGHAF